MAVFLPLPWARNRFFFHQIETPSLTTIYYEETQKERYFSRDCSGTLFPAVSIEILISTI